MTIQQPNQETARQHLAEMRAAIHADDFNQCVPEYLKAKILYTAKSLNPAGRSLSARKIQEIRGLLNDLEAQLSTHCNKCKVGEHER